VKVKCTFGDRNERRVLESTLSFEGWEPLIFINR